MNTHVSLNAFKHAFKKQLLHSKQKKRPRDNLPKEERQGLKIGCIEEAAYRMKFINEQQLEELANPLIKSGYGKYLMNLIN